MPSLDSIGMRISHGINYKNQTNLLHILKSKSISQGRYCKVQLIVTSMIQIQFCRTCASARDQENKVISFKLGTWWKDQQLERDWNTTNKFVNSQM